MTFSVLARGLPAARPDTRRLAHTAAGTSSPAVTPCIASMRTLAPRTPFCTAQTTSGRFATPVMLAATSEAAPQLSVSTEKQDDASVVVTVAVPASYCSAAWDTVIKELRKTYKPDGFRKGKKGKGKGSAKLPEAMLIAECGGMPTVKRACVEQLLMETLPSALSGMEKTAYADSERMVSDADELVASFDKDAPLSYKVAVDVPPEVTFAGPYKGLKVELSAKKSDADYEAAVEAELRSMQKSSGMLKVVTGRGVEQGDTVVIDLAATRSDTGEVIPGVTRNAVQLDTDQAGAFPPAIIEGVLGLETGADTDVTFTFPDEWEPPELRGVPAKINLKLKELFGWELPALDDDFAETVQTGIGGMEELRAALLTTVKVEQELQYELELSQAVMESLAAVVTMPVPDFLLQEIGIQQYQAKLLDAQRKGTLSQQAMEQLLTEGAVQQYIQHNREEIEQVARSTNGVEHIFHAEDIKVDDERIASEMKSSAEEFTAQGMEYDEARLREQVEEMCKGSAVMEFLMEHAEVTYKEA